ncbi:hypothetical protein JN11_01426 [Mucilaginibacter frigoritolerans]|jgi:hypothetical protein|uniref:Uncharacterized protein n=1 Tax=Mucilaginibacter frigoritolerans TaxID=652788 RepID=A0A562U9D7_9SPHI|nr:DUF5908 family protein [Mucilaginibacter frigoritolerans]TWJ02453.1 hypothetical protein JN11_01426 [Mucilaginibacter frigoritolerans]
MPVEIREIQITAAVQDSGGGKSSGNASASPRGGNEDMIAKCVEQVLEILKEQKER